jgi:hypothetical protein
MYFLQCSSSARRAIAVRNLITVLMLLAMAQSSWAQREHSPKAWSGPWTHGAITAGYTYLLADQGGHKYINLNGWFVKPQFAVGRGWSVFASNTNYDGANKKGPINSHALTFGAQKRLPGPEWLRPSAFAEAGDLRVSNVAIRNQFVAAVGAGLLIPFAKHCSLAFTPGEYVFINAPTGGLRNDFNAKAGLSVAF